MAAEIKHVLLCPRCQEGITSSSRVLDCPKCGYSLGAQTGVQAYQPPFTLTEQKTKLNASDIDHLEAVLGLSVDKSAAILNDAFLILETLTGKKVKIEDIRVLVEIGLRIGKVSEAFDGLIRAGGKHVPSYYVHHQEQQQQKKQENKNESTQENAGGKPPPAPLFKDTN